MQEKYLLSSKRNGNILPNLRIVRKKLDAEADNSMRLFIWSLQIFIIYMFEFTIGLGDPTASHFVAIHVIQ